MSAQRKIEPDQFPEAFEGLFHPNRYKVFYGGRGGAKSWNFARALLIRAASQKTRVLCTRELQNSIRESVHKLLKDQIEYMGLQAHFKVTNNAIVGVNGSDFIFEGLHHNVDTIKSIEGVDICWVEEADKVSAYSWKVLVPTIRKEHSEIWVSFNPGLETDETYQRFVVTPPDNALVVKVSWRDNPWFPEVLREEMEHLKSVDHEEYLHVWEGQLKQFADGAIYGNALRKVHKEGRICVVPVEAVEVNTFWDLGRNDHTAIWFHQKIGLQNRFIDYYENRLVDLDHYAKVLQDKGYKYGTHYQPHDVTVQVLGMSKTRKELMEALGIKPIHVVPRIDSVNTGIELTRQAFASAWFDEERCKEGLSALHNYQYVWDDTFNTHRQTPLHNHASNGADAFRQYGQSIGRMNLHTDDLMSKRRREAAKRNKPRHKNSHIV